MSVIPVYEGHEFEALKCRFEDQTELLYRMTLIDLRVFTGYITLQLALGAWIASHASDFSGIVTLKVGMMLIDLVLAVVAMALIYSNRKRREEVVGIVKNCNVALGYEEPGIYLKDKSLNVHTKFRPWAGWYYTGIVVGVVGLALVLFGASALSVCCD
jgi:heme A synthase